MRWFRVALTGFLISNPVAHASEVVWLDQFDKSVGEVPPPWHSVQISMRVPPTQYRLIRWDDVLAIEAKADKSMTLMARPVSINLSRTPILCWQWRVDAPLLSADMAQKSGDDYAARVYVAFKLPFSALGFGTRAKLAFARSLYGEAVPDAALNYVWDNRYSLGTRRPNAYTDRTQMIVAETGPSHAGHWIRARHDVQQDFVAAFGNVEGVLNLLAVASDTDNTGEKAHAGFADFHFVSRDAPCFPN